MARPVATRQLLTPRTPVVARIAALAALAAAALAQTPPADVQTLIPIDRVVATVNDAVILHSEIVALTAGEVSAREIELRRSLTPEERGFLFRRNLERKIDQHALAQAAKTLGVIPPDRVEAILQDQLREEERELIRELGTLQKLTDERRRQNQNSTWQAIEREQRVAKLESLTRQMAVGVRLQNQRNLFITPRMMRDFYRKNREQFVHGTRCQLGSIAISGKDNADAAAALWRTQDLSPQELVERFADRGASLPEVIRIDESSRKTRRTDQVEFALAGPAGSVSDPVDYGSIFRIWKVLEHLPGRDDPFESPAVQQLIRDYMERDVIERLMQQTVDRARQRTEVWMVEDLRGSR